MDIYPWYEIVVGDAPLAQGDFIESCPIIVPPADFDSRKVVTDVYEYDVIVMSQSCDLEQQKLDLVLVCPIWAIQEFEKRNSFFKSRKGKEELRRGSVPGYHLLNKTNLKKLGENYLVIDFRNVYSIPFKSLLSLAKSRGDRLRLLPPYREHLSQAFARFFMRVGLPVDIPPFN